MRKQQFRWQRYRYGVGHAPLTETEQIVRNTEQKLTGEYAESNPVVGQDVKVMGKREGDHIDVRGRCDGRRHVPDLDAYKNAVEVRAFGTDLDEEYTDRDVRSTSTRPTITTPSPSTSRRPARPPSRATTAPSAAATAPTASSRRTAR